ncbi:beta-ketoacyl-[acyl-carrier-protein] synthase family protein [Streptomyces anulatus]|uniref:3-oxoacyl-ACP synthase n=1 Tax=Streptomyces anulatus TaxID=1892 RepID=A0ABZ1ZHM5_STRAQ|nr:beta-ketoacyl synthase N-terminal-like domain-containing protein [Streptomyces anulatus]
MSWPIVGIGALASIGRDPEEIFESLCGGHSGLAPLRGFDKEKFKAGHLFEIDNRAAPGVDTPGRATEFLLDAVGQAARDAGLGEDLSEVPVLIGTGLREMRSLELWWRDGADFAAEQLHFGPALRARFGAADTHTFSNACSASLYALALAFDQLQSGSVEHVIVAGADSITESMFGLTDAFQLEPPGRLRPFDVDRKGTILGEGAGAIVLGRTPGDRKVYGRVRSVGMNCDAHHTTAPDQSGVATAIRQAHTRAGVKPSDVDLVMLHGTGTPLNDEVEVRAMREVFGEDENVPLVTAIKSMTGHTAGSAGVLSLITALLAMSGGRVPPVTELDEPTENISAMRLVHTTPVRADVGVAQINGFGFGGLNAVAIVEAAR